jgi:hypothetical protein
MSFLPRQYGSLCYRGLALWLVWILSMTVWQSSAHATCGDYLMSHGEAKHPEAVSQVLTDSLAERRLPVIPGGCPNGECHSPEQAPEPVGSTVDRRTVDTLRSSGWLTALKSQSHDSSCRQIRPVDEPLPESPFEDALERPPQSPSV